MILIHDVVDAALSVNWVVLWLGLRPVKWRNQKVSLLGRILILVGPLQHSHFGANPSNAPDL
jgi:hypothetical protein